MSKDKITAELVGSKYRAGIKAFARMLGSPTLRLNFTQEADPFFRRCALGVWKCGSPITPKYVDAYNAICSQDNSAPGILYFELCSAVEAAPPFAPPGFFNDLMLADRSEKRDLTGKFIELCSILLLLFAAVDDNVSAEETAYADQCVLTLQSFSGKGSKTTASDFLRQNQSPAAAQAEAKAEQPEAQSESEPPEDLDALLAELDDLCGMEQIKKDVRSLINLVKVRKLREENGLSVPPMSLHLVFMGNPGTGKTTVARLLARLYHSIGVLSKGHLVETDRGGLVAGYIGQTAIKTQEVIDKAMGGVLFIDEAYALTNHEGANDFGQEAIEILLKNMEDHRDNLIVIVAGYTALMGEFIHSNPGLESRFNKYFYFEDYNAEQLLTILNSQCKRNNYMLSDEAQEKAKAFLTDLYENRDENFGNARDVRNLFERLITCQSDRIAAMESPSKDDLMLLTGEDFDAAVIDDEGSESESE